MEEVWSFCEYRNVWVCQEVGGERGCVMEEEEEEEGCQGVLERREIHIMKV